MEVGIHDGVPFSTYVSIRAMNKGGLDEFERSPLHYWAKFLDPLREERDPTPAMRLGSAIHTAILEPERFSKEYRCEPTPEEYPGCLVSADDYKAACKAVGLPVTGKKEELKARLIGLFKAGGMASPVFFDDIVARLSHLQLLSVKDWATVGRIAANVRNCPAVEAILGDGKSERTLVWRDQETGVLCKGRTDWLTNNNAVIADFKSTIDASRAEFSRSCAVYGYHRQAAWYVDGVRAITGVEPTFVFPVYETASPYACAFYYADPTMLRIGRAENRALLRRYAECLLNDEWPGYPGELQPIELPPWKTAKAETLEVF